MVASNGGVVTLQTPVASLVMATAPPVADSGVASQGPGPNWLTLKSRRPLRVRGRRGRVFFGHFRQFGFTARVGIVAH